jgi:hypothetical protein
MSRCWHSSTSYFGFSSSYLTNSGTEVHCEVLDQNRLKTLDTTSPSSGVSLRHGAREQIIGRFLNLDEVRHRELREFYRSICASVSGRGRTMCVVTFQNLYGRVTDGRRGRT